MTARTDVAAKLTTTTLVHPDGRRVELVSLSEGVTCGWVEVYIEYADEPGLMQFRGYYHDLAPRIARSTPRLAERLHPAVQQHMHAHEAAGYSFRGAWTPADA